MEKYEQASYIQVRTHLKNYLVNHLVISKTHFIKNRKAVVLVGFTVKEIQHKSIPKRETQLRKFSDLIGLWQWLLEIVILRMWEGQVHRSLCIVTTQVDPDYIRILGDYLWVSKPISKIPLWLLLQLLIEILLRLVT